MDTRRAQIDDAAEACLIIHRSISELCSLDHGDDEKLLAKWLSNKTVENVRKWILQCHFFVAEEAAKILGVGAIDASGKITLNYVSPDARFRGVSKALVLCMEDQARALGVEECSLHANGTTVLPRIGLRDQRAQLYPPSNWHTSHDPNQASPAG